MATELQAALEAHPQIQPRVVHDHGGEFVNRDVAAVIKAHNLIDIKTRPRHPESNGIVERFNGTVRDETNNDYGTKYLQAEAIIAKLMKHYNEERLHAGLGYMTPATWHRGQPEQVRQRRAGQIAAARAHRKVINQQRLNRKRALLDAISKECGCSRAYVADENIALSAVGALREIGLDVDSVAKTMPGATDEAVLRHAVSRGAVLITFDRDYGELIFKRKLPAPESVLYLREIPASRDRRRRRPSFAARSSAG